jgi:ABC-type transporter Mla subunit MlaD
MLKLALATMLICLAGMRSSGHPLDLLPITQTFHPVDSNDIKKTFHQLLKNKLHASKAVVTSDVIDSLNEFIDKGAATLTQQNATTEQVNQARATLSDFIDSLIRNGDLLRGNEVRISIKSYKKSKKGICPLFPFC